MLKPRKLKNRYQVTKQTTSRTSRAQAVVIYGGKKKLLHLAFEKIRKINKEVEPMLLNPNGRDDFFMMRRVIKDIFRMTQAEWILSWVDDRRELYFHRKFPRPKPFVLSQEALDKILNHCSPDSDCRQRPSALFGNIGINANKEQESASSYVNRKFGLVRQELAAHTVDTDVSEAYNWTTLSVDQIAGIMTKVQADAGLSSLGSGARMPLLPDQIDAILEKAQVVWDKGTTYGLDVLSSDTLVEWLVKHGEATRPKVIDYLGHLNTGSMPSFDPELLHRIRGMAEDINLNFFTDGLASEATISDLMLVSTPERDGGAYYRAIKERTPGDGSIQITIDSLPQLDKDGEDA